MPGTPEFAVVRKQEFGVENKTQNLIARFSSPKLTFYYDYCIKDFDLHYFSTE